MSKSPIRHLRKIGGFRVASIMQKSVKRTSLPIIFLRSSSARILRRAKRQVDYLDKPSVASAERLLRSAEGRLLPSGRKKGRKNCLARARNAHLKKRKRLRASGERALPRGKRPRIRAVRPVKRPKESGSQGVGGAPHLAGAAMAQSAKLLNSFTP